MRLLSIAQVLLFAGCATVLKNEREAIAVDSQPAGADAVIECAGGTRATGVTPTRVTIPRSADGCVLSISKEGHRTRMVKLERGYNAAYWSNFALLPGIALAFLMTPQDHEDQVFRAINGAAGVAGAFGFLVDHQNGRGFRHFPDEISEKLEPNH